MSFLTESPSHTWQPTMTSDTTTPSYWLNWRFFLCALWILTSMTLASFLILKYEGFNKSRSERGENQQEAAGSLYEDEAWNTCVRGIHPAWLLIYRIISFLVLLALLIANVASDGAGIFYFYTQWTFALVTIYFGVTLHISNSCYVVVKIHCMKMNRSPVLLSSILAQLDYKTFHTVGLYPPERKQLDLSVNFPSLCFQFKSSLYDLCCQFHFQLGSSFSIYACFFKQHKFGGNTVNRAYLDAEQISYVAPTLDGVLDMSNLPKSSDSHRDPHARKTAGVWGYIFHIIFQTCAGAVVLTDSVFWLIIYPLLTSKDYSLDFLVFCMHSVNAVFLLGDTSLNCMRFPLFRFAYFVLWTAIFVIFQWIIHVCVSIWWPYPFLDLSSPYAPLWYLAVGLLHIPCYGFFALMVKLKHLWLSRMFPGSCQFVR